MMSMQKTLAKTNWNLIYGTIKMHTISAFLAVLPPLRPHIVAMYAAVPHSHKLLTPCPNQLFCYFHLDLQVSHVLLPLLLRLLTGANVIVYGRAVDAKV